MFFDSYATSTEITIIPRPVEAEIAKGYFTLSPKTVINIVNGEDDLHYACNFFNKLMTNTFGNPLSVKQGTNRKNAVNISVNPSLEKEEYYLDVTKKTINITAGSSQGVFYAFQSLRQLMPLNVENGEHLANIEIQNISIKDKPLYPYRGAMLDVVRHISSKEDIKTFIDMLALHKFNRFHWHLTDDQGWRIEIKSYPELTRVGSMRAETLIKKTSEYDGTPYGGYFTQEDVKEIVQYAAENYITVIPEIELPGHASAALTSYPSLGCTGGPYKVEGRWGVFNDVFCAGNDDTFTFLQGVFDEVIELFPSEYIHVGGDECPKKRWKECPKCQHRIQEENLKNEHELQSYFVERMEKYINSKGRKIIGWDEILEGGISQTATIMSWRGTKGGIEAAKLGNKVIMSPNSHAYLDYYQSKDRENEPLSIGGFVSVEKVYSLNPVEGLNPAEANNVIGVQGNIWREYIKDFPHVQYMALPRIAALAEVGWTPTEMKNYEDFRRRAIILTHRYKALSYNFANHILSEE
ncbi:beta-N-acetylhexosaminidase [Paludibacter sp. 221]|nr:beta-N-acetylhexosaminidase [Paludibacter sp. 221]